jgi:biotin carboxyl carrier protein
VQADGSIKLSDADRRALGLTVSAATEEDLPDSAVRFGVVVTPPGNDAPILAPVTGRIAQPPRVRLGASVRAGETIAEVVPVLDTPDRLTIGTQSAEREGQIDAARREVAKAESDVERARTLAPQVVSAAKLQEAETIAAQARDRLDALQHARSVSSTVQTQLVPIRASLTGTVVALTMNVGTPVKAGDLVGRLLKPGDLWVDVGVPADEPVGDRYEILGAGHAIPARLIARGGITESDGTRHDRLVVEPRDLAALTPGASVTVRVARGTAHGVVVPESSLIPGIDSDIVFIESAPSVFVSRPVRVDARYGGRARVASGIRPGEKVVVQGAMALYGERVRAQLQPS